MMQKIKKLLTHLLVALLTLQGAVVAELLTIKPAHAATHDVIINEVMWMGSTANTSDEWLELRNTTSSPIDLSGWQLANAATSGGILTIPSGQTIAADGYFLIANYHLGDVNTILDTEPDWQTTSISLNNSCIQIDLEDASSSVVDSMGCAPSSKYFFPASAATKHALERNRVIGLGTDSASWHERTSGWANITDAAVLAGNLASPAAANDTTVPDASLAVVNDTDGQTTTDTDITYSADHLYGAWQDFSEDCVPPECADLSYDYGYSLTSGGPVTVVGTTTDSSAIIDLTLTPGQTYYFAVRATNEVNLSSGWIYSDGVTHQAPAVPVISSVADQPNDNGGSIIVDWNAIEGAASYQVNYRLVGDLTWITGPLVTTNSAVVSGLQSTTASATYDYEFQVRSEGYNGLNSAYSPTSASGEAIDNLAPIIDPAKVAVAQNQPGTEDTISGAAGTSNEPDITAYVFFQDPAVTVTTPVPVAIDSNGAFSAALAIGDNLHDKIWVRLFDGTNFSVATLMFTNDIVGPIAPTLTKVVSRCDGDSCRVNLDWTAGSSDTATYKVSYVSGGVTHQTFVVGTTSLTLDLASGQTYQLSVVGYDAYGNPSSISNVFALALTKGVITTITLANGSAVTTTEAISGAREVSTAKLPKTSPAVFVPKVEAAAPTNVTPASETPLTKDSSNSHDWIRIFVVVVLLLIIGGSFYALSRSVEDTPEEAADKAAAKSTKLKPTEPKRRRHRRPRR